MPRWGLGTALPRPTLSGSGSYLRHLWKGALAPRILRLVFEGLRRGRRRSFDVCGCQRCPVNTPETETLRNVLGLRRGCAQPKIESLVSSWYSASPFRRSALHARLHAARILHSTQAMRAVSPPLLLLKINRERSTWASQTRDLVVWELNKLQLTSDF